MSNVKNKSIEAQLIDLGTEVTHLRTHIAAVLDSLTETKKTANINALADKFDNLFNQFTKAGDSAFKDYIYNLKFPSGLRFNPREGNAVATFTVYQGSPAFHCVVTLSVNESLMSEDECRHWIQANLGREWKIQGFEYGRVSLSLILDL